MSFALPIRLPGRAPAPVPESAASAALPVRLITVGRADEQLAVNVAGRLAPGRTPIVCLPGYTRNMADFSAMARLLRGQLPEDWPIVLVDLRGRGRSPRRKRADDYSTTADARDISMLARALGIETAIVIGQGHGGQVAMALALERPTLLAGVVLVDVGPVIAPESLIRLRSNNEAIAGLRGVGGLTVMLRRMLRADYPAADEEAIDRLIARTYTITPAGRAEPLFDPALIGRLGNLSYDDVLSPQWPFFDLLRGTPLMLVRSELTDQLSPAVLDEMMTRRTDAVGLVIDQQGSPPLLDGVEEVRAIADFLDSIITPAAAPARRATQQGA